MTIQRPSKIEYYLEIAEAVSSRSTCIRHRFGAVIVNRDQIISTGYVGAPRGMVNCIDIGKCHRIELEVPPGERYELCRSVHAEMNAIIHASRLDMYGGELYLAGFELKNGSYVEDAEPCKLCKRVIINAGIKRVHIKRGPNSDNIFSIDVCDWIRNEDAVLEKVEGTY